MKSLFCHLFIFAVSTVCCLSPVSAAQQSSAEKMAVLPFETQAGRDISYIRQGISHMLYSRLSWEDRVTVLPFETDMTVLDPVTGLPEKAAVLKVADDTGARYVLCGSVTEFSGAYSLDIQVFDVKEQTIIPFYDQAETIESVIPKMTAIAARINKKVFDRTTAAYKQLEQEKNSPAQALQRMNPENMLPYLQDADREEKHVPWWKFWKHF